jgi:hypothetical protein
VDAISDVYASSAVGEYPQYLEVSIKDSFEIIPDDPSFLKVSQLESKIDDIDPTKRYYVLKAVILEAPELHEATDNSPLFYLVRVGDETGIISFGEYGDRFLSKLHEGDTIRIIGAEPLTNSLQLRHYGVIEKTGVLDYNSLEKLRRRPKILPPKKIVTIGQSRVIGDPDAKPKIRIKVILHKIHISDDFTKLVLTIENMNEEKKVTFYKMYLRLFQGKKQFECLHADPSIREIKRTIHAGFEDTGVLLFEPLDNSQDPVRFHFEFHVDRRGYYYDSDAINISK